MLVRVLKSCLGGEGVVLVCISFNYSECNGFINV